jgi:site-specific DNA recombinase
MSKFKIALYIRVSTEEQAENPEGSIKNQEERLRKHMNYKIQNGLYGEIADSYIDRARSGKDTNRPELQRLLRDIRDKKVNLVMVTELSRFSRSIRDFSEIWEMMQKLGCAFQSLNESFDTTTPAGEMLMFSMANMAQFERKQTVQRINASILSRSQRGLYNGGAVPLGYKLIPEKRGYLAIDPLGAKLVKECFTTFLKAGTLTKTAQTLNDRGFVVKKEKQGGGGNRRLGVFTFDNVYKILTNKMYMGIKAYEDKGVQVETKAVWDAIVTDDMFKKANALLKKNYRRNRKAQHNRYPYLLTGITYCEACGESLWGKSAHGNGGKTPYYEHGKISKLQTVVGEIKKCDPHRFPGRKLEVRVWDEIRKLLTEPKMAKAIIDIAHKKFKKIDKAGELKQITRRTTDVQGKIDCLIERISELPKAVPADSFYRQIERLEDEKLNLSKQFQFQQSNQTQDIPMVFKDYVSFIKGVMAMSEPLAAEHRVRVVEKLVHKVELSADKVRLHYYVGAGKNRDPHFFVGHGSNCLANGGP